MKCVLKKGLAVAFASLLSLGMVFAQEEIEEAGQGFSIGLYDKPYSTTYEISLNAEDYSNSVPGFWVDWKDIPESSRELNWSSSDMNIIKVDMKGRLWPRAEGKAVITAKTKDGKYSVSSEVTVSSYGERKNQPDVGLRVSTELYGESTVTYGADLDTGKSAFSTFQKVKFKVNLIDIGEIWAGNRYSLPIWGDIRVYAAGDALKWAVDAASGSKLSMNDDGDWNDGAFRLLVDSAKIHIGNAYINLYDTDETDLGYVNYTAVPDVCYEFVGVDTERRYGQLKSHSLQTYLSSKSDSDTFYGLQAGYKMNGVFKVDGDFGSTLEWSSGNSDTTKDTADSSQKETDWIYKLTAGLYGDWFGLNNLYVEAGFSNGILGKDSVYKQDLRAGVRAEYKFDLGQYFYLKPQAGLTMVQLESRGDLLPLAMGSVLLGFGGKYSAYDTWFSGNRPWYLKDEHGAYPGITFAAMYADEKIAEQCTFLDETVDTINEDMLILHASFNTGNDLLVKNLEVLGALDIFGAGSDRAIYGLSAGIRYWMPIIEQKVLDVNTGKETTINIGMSPKIWFTGYHDSFNSDNDYAYVKAGFAVSYDRVELSFNYESNDLVNGFFDSGDATYNKAGKLETTFKVWF
ncbi:MAG: hypothetical protein SO116_06030 [Treponema sp.]|nr:autotransporter outer membrane beta-barrel domain-containing protein [Spirochaetia bacterium]MDY4902414.1 hypothetical protein [Treponema sp.]